MGNGNEEEIQVPAQRVWGAEENLLSISDRERDASIQSDRGQTGNERLEANRGNRQRTSNPGKHTQRGTTAGGILHRLIRGTDARLEQLKSELKRLEEDLAEYNQLQEELDRRVTENPRNPDQPSGRITPSHPGRDRGLGLIL
jgi:hypothetical protein